MFLDQIAPGDDETFLRLLTESDLRLLEMGKGRWTRSRVDLTPASGIVTLPITHASILGARVDTTPIYINEETYEFGAEGPGEIEVGGAGGVMLIDQGLDGSEARHYKVTGKTNDDYTVHTLCHYAPFTLYFAADLPGSPALADSATTRCPSAGALKLTMMGVLFEEAHDLGASAHYVAMAKRNLDDREKARRGGNKTSVNVRPYGPGVSGISSYR